MQLKSLRALRAPPEGSKLEPQLQSYFVRFNRTIWRIDNIFTICFNRPDLLQAKR